MSDLLRQTVHGPGAASSSSAQPRPRPNPARPAEPIDEASYSSSSSDSSASSADSAASVNTIRPTSAEHVAPANHWTNFFSQELWLDPPPESTSSPESGKYHVYLTPPSDPTKGPLFICHHGAGSSAMSFAIFTKHLRSLLPKAGILALEARSHGSLSTTSLDFSLQTLTNDALNMINLTQQHLSWPTLPPTILVGHSLGGAILTNLSATAPKPLSNSLAGLSVIDVVEGSALEALGHMQSYLSTRPTSFADVPEAVHWHLRTRTIRGKESAEASVPTLLIPSPTDPSRLIWRTDLTATSAYWDDWFSGMSAKFLRARGGKQLILAGTDRLDKELMIGQMQGKFQLVVVPEAGHFVQEDVPEKTAQLLAEFWRRNDRSSLVLPPKVSELLAQGKKV